MSVRRNWGWVLGGLLPILAWHVATILFPHAVRHALPPLEAVIAELWRSRHYWAGLALTTLKASVFGFLLGAGLAFLTAAACVLSDHVEALLTPSAVVIKAVPAIAFAPLFAVVMPNQMLSRAVIGAAICFFPLFVGSRDAGRAAPERVLTLARIYGAATSSLFVRIQFAYMLHGAATAGKIAAPMAVIGAVIGEWFGGTPQGLGTHFGPTVGFAALVNTYSAGVLAALIGLSLYFTMGALGSALDKRLHLRA